MRHICIAFGILVAGLAFSTASSAPLSIDEIITVLSDPTGNIDVQSWSEIRKDSPIFVAMAQAAQHRNDPRVQVALAQLIANSKANDLVYYRRLMGAASGMGSDGDWFRADAGRESDRVTLRLNESAVALLQGATPREPQILEIITNKLSDLRGIRFDALVRPDQTISLGLAKKLWAAGIGDETGRILLADQILASHPNFLWKLDGQNDFVLLLERSLLRQGVDATDPVKFCEFLGNVAAENTPAEFFARASLTAIVQGQGQTKIPPALRIFVFGTLNTPDLSKPAEIMHALGLLQHYRLLQNGDDSADWPFILARLGNEGVENAPTETRQRIFEVIRLLLRTLTANVPQARESLAYQAELLTTLERRRAGETHLLQESPLKGLSGPLRDPALIRRAAKLAERGNLANDNFESPWGSDAPRGILEVLAASSEFIQDVQLGADVRASLAKLSREQRRNAHAAVAAINVSRPVQYTRAAVRFVKNCAARLRSSKS